MTNESKVRVMVFGTFDYIHEGHLNFFEQAKALAEHPYLIISIARDINVERIKYRPPTFNELARQQAVIDLGIADEVVLGSNDNYLAHIQECAPNIIALGYDQVSYTEGLADDLATEGINCKIVRLLPYFPEKYKSSLVKQNLKSKSKL